MDGYLKAEISASAVRANLALLQGLLAPGTKLCAVVKADCYGHGLDALLGVIAQSADCLAVAAPEEALHLRQVGYERPILVFFSVHGYASAARREALEALLRAGVTITVVSSEEAELVAQAAETTGADAQVHVKVDTGMGRSGVRPERLPALVEALRRHGRVRLGGLYTHFACADEADKSSAREQLDRFLQAAQAAGGRAGLTLHAANSAAAIDLPSARLDMIRPGIALYGYQPSDAMHVKLPLRPALRLVAPLMQVKDVPAGSACGYGLTYRFDRPARVGLVPVGYADGYLRCLAGKATMRLHGRDVPIRGRVSMDQVIVDLTGAPQARPGDEVEVLSPDPAAPHSVENLARLAGTIPYEITVRLGPRVRRVLVD